MVVVLPACTLTATPRLTCRAIAQEAERENSRKQALRDYLESAPVVRYNISGGCAATRSSLVDAEEGRAGLAPDGDRISNGSSDGTSDCGEVCAVCICDFEDGDETRPLPVRPHCRFWTATPRFTLLCRIPTVFAYSSHRRPRPCSVLDQPPAFW